MIATSGQYIFTVSEVNQFIKDLLDNVPPLQEVLLRGELSNYKVYPSGHHYFTLKDSQCSLKCVMFRGSAARLRFRPENGMQVIASGRISVYPRDGAYQLYCTSLTPEGAGDLSVAFEQLKEKLRKEGLFDETHKKPLPPYPRRIAIVTSDFHLCRARLMWGGDTAAVPAHLPSTLYFQCLTVNYFIREAFGLAAYFVYGG